jgi:nickel transport protein
MTVPTMRRPHLRPGARRPWPESGLIAGLTGFLLLLPGSSALGHALLHDSSVAEAVVVQFDFPDGDKPYFEAYRVMAPDDTRPFQSGRINALGEMSFRPDRPGAWRVVVATEDGHGAEVRVDVDPEGVVTVGGDGAGLSQAARLTAGIGYLLGVFGILALWRGRRARHPHA